jgi:hypothetical protein
MFVKQEHPPRRRKRERRLTAVVLPDGNALERRPDFEGEQRHLPSKVREYYKRHVMDGNLSVMST